MTRSPATAPTKKGALRRMRWPNLNDAPARSSTRASWRFLCASCGSKPIPLLKSPRSLRKEAPDPAKTERPGPPIVSFPSAGLGRGSRRTGQIPETLSREGAILTVPEFLSFRGVQMTEDLSRYHQPVGSLLSGLTADWEQYRLNEDQIEFFRENGYLLGVRMFTDKQVEVLRVELDQLIDPEHPGGHL